MRCNDQRQDFPADVSQGGADHRTPATNRIVVSVQLALGRNPRLSSYRHQHDLFANWLRSEQSRDNEESTSLRARNTNGPGVGEA